MNDKMQNQESLQLFIQSASQNLDLQQKLKAATLLSTTDHEAALCSIVEIGKEFGYSFTREEVAERLDITATPSDPSMELSDWELEAVAGGAATNVSCNMTEFHACVSTEGIACDIITQACHTRSCPDDAWTILG